jgi:hypothetical protein
MLLSDCELQQLRPALGGHEALQHHAAMTRMVPRAQADAGAQLPSCELPLLRPTLADVEALQHHWDRQPEAWRRCVAAACKRMSELTAEARKAAGVRLLQLAVAGCRRRVRASCASVGAWLSA